MKKITIFTIVGSALLAFVIGRTTVSSSNNLQSTSADTNQNQKNLVSQAKKPKYTGIVKKIDDIAEQITVRIDNLQDNSNGSGVIIAHEGSTYYVLTAKHVICLDESKTECIPKGQNQIVTPDGKTYDIDPQTVEIPAEWLDLAVVSFESKKTYEVATLGNYQLKDRWIFTSGFPATKDDSEPQRILTGGTVVEKESTDFIVKDTYSKKGGYELVYTNISYQGMSGGAILNSSGQIVGINTASDGIMEITEEGTLSTLNLGLSLGIPINNLIGLANKSIVSLKLLKVDKNSNYNISENDIKSIENELFVIDEPSSDASYVDWINYGNQLWRFQKSELAIEAFNKSISLRKKPHEAHYGIALVYFILEDDKQAVLNLEKATKLQPNYAYYWKMLGIGYDFLEKHNEALFAYDNAIKIEKNYVFYMGKGEVLLGLKKYLEAVRYFTQALNLNQHPWAYHNRGLAYDELGEYDKALANYDLVIKANSQDFYAYTNRCNTLAKIKNYDKALADCNQALKINFLFAMAWYNRGVIYHDLGEHYEAISNYDSAILFDHQYSEAYNNRGSIYSDLKKYNKAIADFDKSIDINPQYALAYYNRGTAYANLRKYRKAITDFNKSITINSQYASAYYNRGLAYEIVQKYQKSIEDYTQAIYLDSKYEQAYENRGLLYTKLEEYDKAIDDLNKAISLNPNKAMNYYILSTIYLKLGEEEKATANYNQALDVNPQIASNYHITQGIYNYQSEKYNQATNDFQQVLQTDSESFEAFKYLGLIAYERRQISKAIEYWDQAFVLTLDPIESHSMLLAIAVASYQKEKSQEDIEFAAKLISMYKQIGNINFLKDQLWGNKLIEDTQALFDDEKLQSLIN